MAATTQVLVSGRNKLNLIVRGEFSVADETDTVVVDKSTLTGPDGTAPGSVRVDEVTWSIGAGFDYIRLEWDHDTDDKIVDLTGQGYLDFRPSGGLNDPRSTGGTGDIVLTSLGGAAGDVYFLVLHCTLKD